MPVHKSGLVNYFTTDQGDQINALVEKIDRQLLNDYIPDSTITVLLSSSLHPRVQIEITRLYEEAGWRISFSENWIELK